MRRTIIALFLALATLLIFTAAASAATVYRVQPGDTLFLIAQKYGISYQDLQAANSLYTPDIYPGQALTIPTKSPNVSANNNQRYIVQPGDTIFLIARKYGVNYVELQRVNNLSSPEIYPGQSLIIPTAPAAANTGGYTTYKVQPGDSLYLIARKFGVTVGEIQSINGLQGSYIEAGQNLKIPAARTAQTVSRGSTFSWRELQLMASVVNGEARGEPFIGQVAVAAVILNRLRHANFPKTIAGVIYQPGAFTAVADGQIHAPLVSSCMRAVNAAIEGWDPTNGALYYWNPATATNKWVWTRQIITKIGNHVFAR